MTKMQSDGSTQGDIAMLEKEVKHLQSEIRRLQQIIRQLKVDNTNLRHGRNGANS